MVSVISLQQIVRRSLAVALVALAQAFAQPAPPNDPNLKADGLALLRQWHPPIYPPAALKARHSGMVTVRLIVDEKGQVTAARALEDSDQDFVESALTAVKKWSFSPAEENGRAVPCCLETLVAFSPSVGQQKASANLIPPDGLSFMPAPRVAPRATVSPPGNYPEVLRDRKFGGVIRFDCRVNATGKIEQPRIVAASHVDFVLPALESLQDWQFEPAMQGDLAVPASIDGEMTFDALLARASEVLEANGITSPDGTPPSVAPEPVVIVDPVWPYETLIKGEGGSAVVSFKVNETGSVSEAEVQEATQPEFGQALVAAVEAGNFNRPIENNRVVRVALARKWEFKAVPMDASDSDPMARLVLAMRRGEIAGAKGLDAKLAPIYRVRPDYPRALKARGGPAGRAEIEFVVDRDGRVRLPRIVTATEPELGWAAATAVAQWIFTPPKRGGEPVDVKVKIPMDFAAAPPASE
jgi:TonB family protein